MTDPGPTPAVGPFGGSGRRPRARSHMATDTCLARHLGPGNRLLGAAGLPQSLVGPVWLPDDSFCLFRCPSFDPVGEITTGRSNRHLTDRGVRRPRQSAPDLRRDVGGRWLARGQVTPATARTDPIAAEKARTRRVPALYRKTNRAAIPEIAMDTGLTVDQSGTGSRMGP